MLMAYIAPIEGTWINKEYYESIIRHKSPYKAVLENPYYLIYIKKDMIKGNMIGIYDYEYGQTESSNVPYYALEGKSLKYMYNTFGEKMIADDAYHYLKQIQVNSDKTELCVVRSDNQSFCLKKIDDNCIYENFDCEIDNFILSSILQGSYKVIDGQRNVVANKIEIDSFGITRGLKGYSSVILWSFFREVNNVFKSDILEFIPDVKNDKNNYGFYNNSTENLFKFEYMGDSIKLRTVKYYEVSDTAIYGDIKYWLIKL